MLTIAIITIYVNQNVLLRLKEYIIWVTLYHHVSKVLTQKC